MTTSRTWLLQQLHAANERDLEARRAWALVGIGCAGVAFGAAIAALLTPRSGPQLRATVVRKAHAFANPFGFLREEETRPEPLTRIIADERAELAAKARALNDDHIDVDTVLPIPTERTIV